MTRVAIVANGAGGGPAEALREHLVARGAEVTYLTKTINP